MVSGASVPDDALGVKGARLSVSFTGQTRGVRLEYTERRADGGGGSGSMRKLLAVLMLFGAAAGVARAEETAATPEALARVFACQSITDPGERVTCYDAAVGQLHAAETQGQIVAVDRAQAQDIARDSFGFQLPSLSRLIPRLGGGSDENMDAVQLVVERVISRADGTHAFVMNNGQIWAQIERQEARNVQPGDEVTIRRAALGSFRLVSSRGGAGHRVRREN